MGNRKGRARRNHKPNNWKAMLAKKKEKMSSISHEAQTDSNLSLNEGIHFEGEVFVKEPDDEEMKSEPEETEFVCDVEMNEIAGVYEVECECYVVFFSLTASELKEVQTTPQWTQGVDPFSPDMVSDTAENNHGDRQNDDDENPRNDENVEDEVEANNSHSGDEEGDEEDFNEAILSGRRLFDVANLFEKIQRISKHSKNCGFDDMKLMGEVKKGLNSIFKFRCGNCGVIRNLESCPKKTDAMTVNQEAVLGVNLIGSGFYHLQEFLTNLGVPCLSSSTYENISNVQQPAWHGLAQKHAMDALFEEINQAVAAGDIDSEGNALITVICDGGWGKRSYGKAFNSLSGCAALVGVRTKKVVYFGSRNKYCHVCKIAAKNDNDDEPVKEHACNINYKGPSSGMEADIIVEGFKECEKLGARFHKMIADGDSSTYKTLRDLRLYKYPDLVIEKLECVNHLCRNFRSRFGFLDKVTKFDIKLRKHVKPSKGNDICKGVKTAAKHWRESDLSITEKLRNLETDIMNAPAHYFGVHTHCRSYFCSKTTSTAALNNFALLKDDGLYYEVLNLCQVYFASNSKSLLENRTNNAAEEFNNIVAKYLGGKRVNYSLGRSYSARVAMAVVHYNSRGHPGSLFRNFQHGDNNQSSNTLSLENSRRQKVVYNATKLQTKPRDRHSKESSAAAGYFHGDGSEDVDMSPEQFENCKKIFLEKLEKWQGNRENLERQTIDKKLSPQWQVVRQDMFPAEHFYRVVNAIKYDSYPKILQEILYTRSEFGNNAQIKHQRLVERDALAVCKDLFPDEIEECGLFIDKEFPFLCASPLVLCGNDHIINIKCPVKEYNRPFDKVISKLKFFKTTKNDYRINEKSEWYIELQGQMRIADRKYAHLMIWLGVNNYRIIEVPRDDQFFEDKMKEKLIFFYNECMLKELVNSRVARHMKIRTYDAVESTFV